MRIVKIRPEPGLPMSPLLLLASNQATLALLLLLALATVVYYRLAIPGRVWLIAIPALLLIVNFLLALATRDILKNNWPLMIFHFALIALVLLAFAGRLSYFKATLELGANEEFNGQLENLRQGPWHRYGLTAARFTNLGFRIHYHAGVKRDETVNRILLSEAPGRQRLIEIGDHVPLVIGHYRFYTSHNKGFAPVFEWRPRGTDRVTVGSIHLPSYPVNEFRQALEWRIPGTGQRLWTMLDIDEELLPLDREFDFRVPREHRLILRFGERREELRPGDVLQLAQGTLTYRELTTWMGYKVDYDWTRPWLLATVLIGLLGLFAHYIVKFRRLR